MLRGWDVWVSWPSVWVGASLLEQIDCPGILWWISDSGTPRAIHVWLWRAAKEELLLFNRVLKNTCATLMLFHQSNAFSLINRLVCQDFYLVWAWDHDPFLLEFIQISESDEALLRERDVAALLNVTRSLTHHEGIFLQHQIAWISSSPIKPRFISKPALVEVSFLESSVG